MLRPLLAWMAALALSSPEPAVTTPDVVAMVPLIPAAAAARPGHFERSRDSGRIAAAIAQAVDEETTTVLGTRREDAALVLVFAAYESGLHVSPCANGDGGASLGPLQLQGTRAGVACDPLAAARIWLGRAREAMRTCVEEPAEERLALLASGRCTSGRAISRRRVEIAIAVEQGQAP